MGGPCRQSADKCAGTSTPRVDRAAWTAANGAVSVPAVRRAGTALNAVPAAAAHRRGPGLGGRAPRAPLGYRRRPHHELVFQAPGSTAARRGPPPVTDRAARSPPPNGRLPLGRAAAALVPFTFHSRHPLVYPSRTGGTPQRPTARMAATGPMSSRSAGHSRPPGWRFRRGWSAARRAGCPGLTARMPAAEKGERRCGRLPPQAHPGPRGATR